MRRRLAFVVMLLAALSLAVTTSAGKPAKDTPITVAFTEGYAIQSDNGQPYVHGEGGVRAVFVPLGNPVLDLRATVPPRTLSLDFGYCVSGTCNPPDLTDAGAFFMSTSYCDKSFLEMGLGESQRCRLNVNFGAAGLGWFLRFGEYSTTTHATVVHQQDGSWTVDVPENGKAKLLSHPTKGKVVLTDHGDYVMPVHMTVTLQ